MTMRRHLGPILTVFLLIAAGCGDSSTDPDGDNGDGDNGDTEMTLTVTGSSTGTGTVTSNPAGINCTSTAGVVTGTCVASFDDGVAVTLTGLPAAGSTAVVWTGACTGSAACDLTMDADRTVDAEFDVAPALPTELIGTWDATSLVFTPDGGGATADPILDGLVLTLVFRDDFTYTITEDEGPPEGVEVENGIVTVTEGGSVLTLIPNNAPDEAEDFVIETLTSTDLTVSVASTTFDFNDDGTETPASLAAAFVKQ